MSSLISSKNMLIQHFNKKKKRTRERLSATSFFVLEFYRLLCNGFEPVGTLRFSSPNCMLLGGWPLKRVGWKTCRRGGLLCETVVADEAVLTWEVKKKKIRTMEQSWKRFMVCFLLRGISRYYNGKSHKIYRAKHIGPYMLYIIGDFYVCGRVMGLVTVGLRSCGRKRWWLAVTVGCGGCTIE